MICIIPWSLLLSNCCIGGEGILCVYLVVKVFFFFFFF